MIDRTAPLPVTRQCQLLNLSRSGVYYTPIPVSAHELELMRHMDEIHLELPFYGSRRIRNELEKRGYRISRGQVRRLMQKMGIVALYRKPRLSVPHPTHKVYPYLLRGVEIIRANHVWTADITYIPMTKGFCYLVAIMDWASRKVLSWRLSNTMDASFCLDALEEAMSRYGTPEVFNTDQGSQFTSEAFTEALHFHGVKVSMDGRGRWLDNVFIERLWRSVKYEEVYLKGYTSISTARNSLTTYFDFYNTRRFHQGLDDRTPDAVYWDTFPHIKGAA